MARRVANINLPGIQIPVVDQEIAWQYPLFLFYGYTPIADGFFMWREVDNDGSNEAELNDEDSNSMALNAEESNFENLSISAEFTNTNVGDESTTWTKLSEFYDKSGED